MLCVSAVGKNFYRGQKYLNINYVSVVTVVSGKICEILLHIMVADLTTMYGTEPITRKIDLWVQTQQHQIINSGSEPTTRKIDLWVQTLNNQIVNSGSEPTTRKIDLWVQTQKHQIVNSGSEPITRKINPWVQTQIHQIVNSGFGPILY